MRKINLRFLLSFKERAAWRTFQFRGGWIEHQAGPSAFRVRVWKETPSTCCVNGSFGLQKTWAVILNDHSMRRDLDVPYGDFMKGYPMSYAPYFFTPYSYTRYSLPALSQYGSAQPPPPRRVIAFKGSSNITQTKDFIRVQRAMDRLWSVTRRIRPAMRDDFKIKFHAVAYARALSYSLHLPLFIDDSLGCPIKQSPASLTYPVTLE